MYSLMFNSFSLDSIPFLLDMDLFDIKWIGVGRLARCKRPCSGTFFSTFAAQDGGWYGCDVSGWWIDIAKEEKTKLDRIGWTYASTDDAIEVTINNSGATYIGSCYCCGGVARALLARVQQRIVKSEGKVEDREVAHFKSDYHTHKISLYLSLATRRNWTLDLYIHASKFKRVEWLCYRKESLPCLSLKRGVDKGR